MSVEIRVPPMGESIAEASVGRWLKQAGVPVKAGEPIVELETDKVNLEVPAPQDGTLEQIAKNEGDTVTEGDVLGTIAEGAAQPAPARGAVQASPNGTSGATTPSSPGAPSPAAPQRAVAAPSAARVAETGGEPAKHEPEATPVARRLAAQYGINLSEVPGSGREGRVVQKDVESFIEKQTAPQPAAAQQPVAPAAPVAPPVEAGREERVRLSRRRLTIASRLVEAHHTAVMTTTFNEIDMSSVIRFRKERREAFKQRHEVDLGFMSFFVRAVVGALKAFPRLNSRLDGEELVMQYHYDIGIAVASDEGLVVPVLRNADRMSFADVERAISGMVQRTKDRALTLEELQGGTFTITNGGVFGSLLSTPILNPPQVAILGMHRIQERPVAVDGKVEIRPMMNVAVTYDHRIVDGGEAVRFLVRIKELVEDVGRSLLDA